MAAPSVFEQHGGESQPYSTYLANFPGKITVITDYTSMPALAKLVATIDWTLCNMLIVFKDSRRQNITSYIHPNIILLEYDDGVAITTLVNDLIAENMIQTPYFYIAYEGIVPTSVWLTMRLSATNSGAYAEMSDSGGLLASCDYIWTTSRPFHIGIQLCPIEMSFKKYIQSQIQSLTIDTSASYSGLCSLATQYQTDKSVYNFMSHRHPYTQIYNMFLGGLRTVMRPLVIGEIGVLNGASIRMWRDYFGDGHEYHAFDIDNMALQRVETIARTHELDSGNIVQLNEIFSALPQFDILLEDASHRLEHQVTAIRECMKYVRVGGLFIVEDIFREINISRFQEAINAVVASGIDVDAFMITPEHTLRSSPTWENDRMLIVRRLS